MSVRERERQTYDGVEKIKREREERAGQGWRERETDGAKERGNKSAL